MSDRDVNININGKDNASRVIGQVGRSFDSLNRQLGSLKTTFGALIGARVVGNLVGSLMDTATAMDEIGDASDRIGIATENLLGLSYAAKLSGVNGEALETALIKMNRNLSEVASGGGKAASDALTELGLNITDLRKLSPDQQFGEIADAMNRVPDAADKIRISMDLFGRAGADLSDLLAKGSAGIRELHNELDAKGGIFSRDEAEKMARINDQIDRMNTSLNGLKITLLGMVAEDLTFGLTAVTDALNGKTENATNIAKQIGWSSLKTTAMLGTNLLPDLYQATLGGGAQPGAGDYLQSTPALGDQTAAAEAAVAKQAKFNADALSQEFSATWSRAGKVGSGVKNWLGELVGTAKTAGMEMGNSLAASIEIGMERKQQRIKDRIAEITDSVKTPREQFLEAMAEVDLLAGKGLDPATAERQRKALREQFESTLPKLQIEIPQLAAREFRALTRAPGASSPELQAAIEAKRQTKLAERQAALLVENNRLLQEIVDQQPEPLDL